MQQIATAARTGFISGPAILAALNGPLGKCPLANGVRFALLAGPRGCDPVVARRTLANLALHIHARRGGQGLQLADVAVTLEGEAQARRMVAVHLHHDHAGPAGFLGYAWLAGRGRRDLEAALYAIAPNPAARAEAQSAVMRAVQGEA